MAPPIDDNQPAEVARSGAARRRSQAQASDQGRTAGTTAITPAFQRSGSGQRLERDDRCGRYAGVRAPSDCSFHRRMRERPGTCLVLRRRAAPGGVRHAPASAERGTARRRRRRSVNERPAPTPRPSLPSHDPASISASTVIRLSFYTRTRKPDRHGRRGYNRERAGGKPRQHPLQGRPSLRSDTSRGEGSEGGKGGWPNLGSQLPDELPAAARPNRMKSPSGDHPDIRHGIPAA